MGKNRTDIIQFDRKTTNYTQETVEGCDLGDHLGNLLLLRK